MDVSLYLTLVLKTKQFIFIRCVLWGYWCFAQCSDSTLSANDKSEEIKETNLYQNFSWINRIYVFTWKNVEKFINLFFGKIIFEKDNLYMLCEFLEK